MSTFRAIHILNSKDSRDEGRAVQRSDSNGPSILVTRLSKTDQEAANEVARLTREAARGAMA